MSHQLCPWIVAQLLKITEWDGEFTGNFCQINILHGMRHTDTKEQFYDATISDGEVTVPIRIPASVAKSTEDEFEFEFEELSNLGSLNVTLAKLVIHVHLVASRRILTACTLQLMSSPPEPLVGVPQPYEQHSELSRWFSAERDQTKTQANEDSFSTSEPSKYAQLLSATLLSDIRPMEVKSKRSWGKFKLAWDNDIDSYCPTDASNNTVALWINYPSTALTEEPVSQQDTDMEDSEDEHVDDEANQVAGVEALPLSSWDSTPHRLSGPQQEEVDEDDKCNMSVDDDLLHPSSPLVFGTTNRDRDHRSSLLEALQLPPPIALPTPLNLVQGLSSTPVPPRKPLLLDPYSDPSSQSQPPTQERLDSSQDQNQEKAPASQIRVKVDVEDQAGETRASESEAPSDSESDLSDVSLSRSQSQHDAEEVENGLSPLKLVEIQGQNMQSSSDEEEEGEERKVSSARHERHTKIPHNARSPSHLPAALPKRRRASHESQPTDQSSLKQNTQSSNTSNSLPSKEDDVSRNKYPSPVSQIPSPPPSLLGVSSQEVDDEEIDGDDDERELQLSLPETPIKTSHRRITSSGHSKSKPVSESPSSPSLNPPKTQAATGTPSRPSQAAKSKPTPINGLVRSGKGRPELFGKSNANDRCLGGSKPRRPVAANSIGKGMSKAETNDGGSSTLEEEDEVEVAAPVSAPPKSKQKPLIALALNEKLRNEVTRRSRVLLESDEEEVELAPKKGGTMTRLPAPKRNSDVVLLRKAHLTEHTAKEEHTQSPQHSSAIRSTRRIGSVNSRQRNIQVTFAPLPLEGVKPSIPVPKRDALRVSSRSSLLSSQQPHSAPHPRAPHPGRTHRAVSTDLPSVRSQARLSAAALKFNPILPISLPLLAPTSRPSSLSRTLISDVPNSIRPSIQRYNTSQLRASAPSYTPTPAMLSKRRRANEEQGQHEKGAKICKLSSGSVVKADANKSSQSSSSKLSVASMRHGGADPVPPSSSSKLIESRATSRGTYTPQWSQGQRTSFRPTPHPAFLTTRDLQDVIRRLENWRLNSPTSRAK